MKLTGVEVAPETLSKIEPDTILVVISDDQGKFRVVKIDPSSIVMGEAFLKVVADASDKQPGGCWVMVNGVPVWKDPCPY